ncbi:MAG: hypothetical protein FWD72_00700, partial [Eggerthellaceae bacterium]|nr:hypothetical protein [Eggerthellaceae bacterium]
MPEEDVIGKEGLGERNEQLAQMRLELDRLSSLGFSLNDPAYFQELVNNLGVEYFVASSYYAWIVAMGNEVEKAYRIGGGSGGEGEGVTDGKVFLDAQGDPLFFSDSVWYLDTECIDDEDSYPFIIRRLAQMAKGALGLQRIECVFDEDEQAALVSMSIKGVQREFQAELNGDWLDTGILVWANSLLDELHGPNGKRFFVIPPDDQSLVVLFTDEPSYQALMEIFGVPESDWKGKPLAQVLQAGSSAAYQALGKAPRKGGCLKVVLALAALALAIAAIVVVGYGGNLPFLKE